MNIQNHENLTGRRIPDKTNLSGRLGLLEYIAHLVRCDILSDLRYEVLYRTRIRQVVKTIPKCAYSDLEWLNTAEYIMGIHFTSAQKARTALEQLHP